MFGGLQSRTGVCGASSADRESSAPGRQQLKTDSYSAKFQRSHPRCLFKHGNKMTGVGKTGHAGDVLYF